MPRSLDARAVAQSLVGKTVHTPAKRRPNRILSVGRRQIIVATEDSPQGEDIDLRRLQEGLDLLFSEGAVRIDPSTFNGYRRSSFIGAVLASLPATVVEGPRTEVRLQEASPLRDAFVTAGSQIREGSLGDRVSKDNPVHNLVVHELPLLLQQSLGNEHGYLTSGSVGQATLAETPWVAIFDRLVTVSAQEGHYIVFLIHSSGEKVDLSLNQGITQIRASRRNFLMALRERSIELGHHLDEADLVGLHVGPLDLEGRGQRTRGYEAGSIVSSGFEIDDFPHDAALLWEVQRFLNFYSTVTTGLTEEDATRVSVAPKEAKGKEVRRLAWHLVAEGRNSVIARRAKAIQGYQCQVCGYQPPEELGNSGRRCIEAHHLTPFKDLDERPRHLDPERDFAIVCANCHRLLHSEYPPMSATQLRKLLGGAARRSGSDGTRTRDLRRDRPAL
jgi:5-methylcytosine-specific restriction protein A